MLLSDDLELPLRSGKFVHEKTASLKQSYQLKL